MFCRERVDLVAHMALFIIIIFCHDLPLGDCVFEM